MTQGLVKRKHVGRADIERRLREKALAGDVPHICLAELVEMAGEEQMILMYQKEDIELCLNLLNGLTISGISNAEKIAVIGQRLQSYKVQEEKKDNGEHSEEE